MATGVQSPADGAASTTRPPRVVWISLSDLFNKLQFGSNMMLVDLQTAENFGRYHVRSALNVDWTRALQFAEDNEDFDDPTLIMKHVSEVHDRRFRLRGFCQVIVYGGVTNFDTDGVSGEAASAASDLAGRIDSPDISSREIVLSFAECLIAEKKITKDVLLVEGGIELLLDCRPYLVVGTDAFVDVQFPSEVIEDLLYIGSAINASNHKCVELLGITHVLNATNDCPCSFEGEVKYLQCHVEDDLTSNIKQYFDEVMDFLESAAENEKNRILIHCKMGMSRSAAFVILYLMKSRRMSLKKAYNFLKATRPFVNPNPSFLHQLAACEKATYGSATIRFPSEQLSMGTLYEWLDDDGKTWTQRVVVRTAS